MKSMITIPFTASTLKIRDIMLALLPAMLVTNDIFISYIQGRYPFISLRRLAFAILMLAFLWVLASIAISQLPKLILVIGKREFQSIAILCAVAGSLMILSIHRSGNLPAGTLLYPINEIQITALDDKNPESTGDAIEILLFDTQFGFNSFSQFQTEGDWKRTDANTYLLISEERPGNIRWQGRTGAYIVLELWTGPDAGKVAVAVNGERSEVFDLYSKSPDMESLYFKFSPIVIERITSILSRFTSVFLILLVSGVLLFFLVKEVGKKYQRNFRAATSVLLRPTIALRRTNGYWLLYAIPMIIIWGIGLMALYPGLVSTDSTSHFRQAWQGGYDNWHSVFYTLLVAGLTVVVKSPAMVAGFQVLAFAIGIAWGMKILDDMFCPAWVPWLLSVLIAVALPNFLTIITIWKDVPYTLSMFLLTLILLRIVQTDGAWLEGKTNWLWLGLISLLVVLFRQNGLFVPLTSFGILFLLYSKHWRQLTLSFTLALAAFLTFTGPVHRLLRVEDTARFKINEVILHHLAAHQAAGTPISADDSAFLNKILPPAEWEKYNCATVNNLFFNPVFDRNFMNLNTAHAAQMLGRFFIASPGVDLRHMMCAGALVWQGNARTYLVESAFDLDSGKWVTENSLGIVQDSRLPGVASTLHAWMEYIDSRENTLIYNLTWRPANFLYIAIICWVILARRKRDYRYIYTLTPILVHSMSVFLVNFAQDFRYQYPAFMLGIYGLGFLLVKKRSNDERDTQQPGGKCEE